MILERLPEGLIQLLGILLIGLYLSSKGALNQNRAALMGQQ